LARAAEATVLISRNFASGIQAAKTVGMSIGSLSNIASGYVQSLVGNILANQSTGNTTSSSASPVSQTADINQLSPFAEMLSTLQQLQQSNPTQYQQVTQQIATNLTTAANTATANGNTTAASTLNQLATDFTNASQNNTLPNIQDLAQAAQSHGHHGHHCHGGSGGTDPTDPSSSNSTDSSASSATSDLMSQLIASYQSTAAGLSQSTDPMSIITNTLASAGIDL
jgi:hypothetical protein